MEKEKLGNIVPGESKTFEEDNDFKRKTPNKGNKSYEEEYYTRLYIRIDMKYDKIYIHKNTMEAIYFPEFIRLAYKTRTKQMMILPAEEDEKNSLRVKLTDTRGCCVYSRGLLRAIRTVSDILVEKKSYLVEGLLDAHETAVCFNLEDAVPDSTYIR